MYPLFAVHILTRRHVELPEEVSCEVALGAETDAIGYFIDAVFAFGQ